MKLFKISLIKNYFIEGSSYGLFNFDLQDFSNCDRVAWGNLLRRTLLKDLEGLRFGNSSIFISRSFSKIPYYHRVNEYSDIEQVNPSLLQVFSNFRNLHIFSSKPFYRKTSYSMIKVLTSRSYFSKDILLPNNLYVVNPDVQLFEFLSKRYKLRIISEICKGSGKSFSPIKKVNYVVEGIPYASLLLEIYTDLRANALSSLLATLRLINPKFAA
uniref:DNA-directed RNA polymerase subunit alpha n=1 Tax=Euglena stellata TaxID=38278 RepID=RPOA_EUGST|nr:RecName: Full=DNA-directed RNA polymerase subunit alpha; Short=PEP; AltName: Full=Plastid-encoded RNA polymerase subunit alpha; Short=RNA polymerase subunit alpha [Euglena stellata]AAL83366.1 RNA polymerase alpha subunit [Euglena stellata]